MVTHTYSPSPGKAKKLRQEDHHQLSPQNETFLKSTEHFPQYRTDLTSTYAVPVLKCVVEKYNVKNSGAAGDPVERGDTCYVGRAPTGKRFRKSSVIYSVVAFLQGAAIDPSAAL